MRKLPLILTFALAAACHAPLALAQPGPTLPENLPAAPMLNDNQVKVIADVQPGYKKVPAWLYYRLFDREYYAMAVSR